MLTVTPNQNQIYQALNSFLQSILPTGTEIVVGNNNRTPQPKSPNFVVMTVIRRERLETNVDTFQDCGFIGSIAGNILNVEAFAPNSLPLSVGQPVWGTGVVPGTLVTGTTLSVGGTGPFNINIAQNAFGSMSAGGFSFLQPTLVVIQCDVHSADAETSSDMAQIISTMLRDQYAVSFFNGLPWDIWPIHADDPRQAPWIDAEQQYETRNIVEVNLQANQVITGIGQQAFDIVTVNLIEVP